jgi:hypothetical protein
MPYPFLSQGGSASHRCLRGLAHGVTGESLVSQEKQESKVPQGVTGGAQSRRWQC